MIINFPLSISVALFSGILSNRYVVLSGVPGVPDTWFMDYTDLYKIGIISWLIWFWIISSGKVQDRQVADYGKVQDNFLYNCNWKKQKQLDAQSYVFDLEGFLLFYYSKLFKPCENSLFSVSFTDMYIR